MTAYFRPIAQIDPARPKDALPIAGGWTWFNMVEVLERGKASKLIKASEVPEDVLNAITSSRAQIAGMSMQTPRIMGILNVTPDSFSDGGRFNSPDIGVSHALEMAAQGADILDIGGESTRPGAVEVQIEKEITRTAPIISAIRANCDTPISIDTRKSQVAEVAVAAGANLINDVAAFEFDPDLAGTSANLNVPVCLMHSQGRPENMQNDPRYDNVLLDIYDYLQSRIDLAVSSGINRAQIVIDPGVGFGKTLDHNIQILKGISLFHALGCPILLGVSRKRFIGTIGQTDQADQRMPGSIAVAMAAVSQGVQILRVHDVPETKQALALHMAVTSPE